MTINRYPRDDTPASALWYGCFFLVMVFVVGGGLLMLGFLADDAGVVQETVGLRAARDKYEWFKSAADNIQAKRANIQAQKAKIASIQKGYADTPRARWDRVDKENLAIWETELAGMVSAHNNLVAEYNAAAKKITWNFARSSELPKSFDMLTQ